MACTAVVRARCQLLRGRYGWACVGGYRHTSCDGVELARPLSRGGPCVVRRTVLREMSAVCQDARSPSVEVLCTNEGTVSTVCGLGWSLGCVDRAKPRVRPRRTSAVGCGPEATLKLRLGSSMGISTRCMGRTLICDATRCTLFCAELDGRLTRYLPPPCTTPCDVRSWRGRRGLRVPPSSSLVGQNVRR